MSGAPAVVVLGARSAALAARIVAAIPDAELHAPDCAASPADRPFRKLVPHLRELFFAGRPIVGICAAGILVRALAPLLADKHNEPPVIAVAEDGRSVVPLLGGHHGANRLAKKIAAALSAHCAVTTASDSLLGRALDEPPPGWRLADPALAAPFMARLLDGEPVRVTVDAGDAGWLDGARLRREEQATLEILATHRRVAATAERLVLHPPALAMGVGCERGARAEELVALAKGTLDAAGLAPAAVACVASLDLKAAEPAIHALAKALDRPARFFSAAELEAETARLATPSAAVHAATGLWGVAEAAALHAAGPEARLIVAKRRSARCTCAVALAPGDIDPMRVGRPRGLLSVVGIGPGDPGSRTADVVDRLGQAEMLVGYGLYLDLVDDLAPDAARHPFPLGAETERCRFALEKAADGRRVALVSSGDPGIYAMAALVVELAANGENSGWERVEIEVLPGISAFQAAAARVGAAIGHDFCAISLSDLLTPWELIERRLEAVAAADLVVALYNPVSARRRAALPRARAILLAARPPATPVVLARNLGRAEERVAITTLAELDPDAVDMLTLVLVGSSTSRRVARLDGRDLVLTPRGYPLR